MKIPFKDLFAVFKDQIANGGEIHVIIENLGGHRTHITLGWHSDFDEDETVVESYNRYIIDNLGDINIDTELDTIDAEEENIVLTISGDDRVDRKHVDFLENGQGIMKSEYKYNYLFHSNDVFYDPDTEYWMRKVVDNNA